MRYLDETRGQGEEKSFILEHEGEELSFVCKPYKTLKMIPEIIADINHFWRRLPKERQDQIWATYKEIDQLFLEINNPDRLNEALKQKVAYLIELHPFEDALRYLRRHSDVEFPRDLKETEADMTERDTHPITYFRADYENLAAWIIQLRAFLPVYTKYLSTAGQHYDSESAFYMGVKLLQRSDVMQSKPYLRLKEYCDHFWKGNTKTMAGSALLAGISSSEVPLWLVSYVIAKLLLPGHISQLNTSTPIKDMVVSIFHQVKSLSDDLTKHFTDRVTEKRRPESASGEEDRTSVAENYKTKQEVNEGDLLSHEFQSHQGSQVGFLVTKDFDEKLYRENLINFDTFPVEVNDFQRTVCQWVLSEVVSPRALFYIDFPGMVNYLATTQTLLMQWGFDRIAQMLSGRTYKSTIALFASNRTEISNQQFAKLDVYYPHFLQQTRQKFDTKKRRNAAAADIDKLVTTFAVTHWEIAYPPTLQARLEQQTEARIPFPSTMEYDLADLLIFLYEHRLKKEAN